MSEQPTDNRRLTFLLAYGDEARIDVMLSPEKTYYRIDFPDTLEDGELPGLRDKYEQIVSSVKAAFEGDAAEISPLRFRLFVNNVAATPKAINKTSLQRFVDILAAEYDEMAVLYQLINN